MNPFRALLRALQGAGVRFIVVGGVAAVLHGSSRLTQDVDVVYDRSEDNLKRLAKALARHRPYLSGAPQGLPFLWEAKTIRAGLNFTLTTALGDIDLLGEITGGGGYGDLLRRTVPVRAFGMRLLCLDLPTLIRVKRAAGRPKDLDALAELEAIAEERERREEE